jgi:hypothetical protein
MKTPGNFDPSNQDHMGALYFHQEEQKKRNLAEKKQANFRKQNIIE